MKGTFTLVIALMLSLTINAQVKLGEPTPARGILESTSGKQALTPGVKKNNAPMRKIQIDEGEHLMGFYTTDDLPIYGLAFNSTGTYYVGNLFDEEVIGNFVGGDIMRFRFALQTSATVYSAFIYAVDAEGYLSGPLASVSINKTCSAGWNDVELTTPVTIEEGVNYLIGYAYQQNSTDYPMGVDYTMETDIDCDYFYYTSDPTYSWNAASGYGALCLQAVVKGGNFIDDDLALSKLTVRGYASQEDELPYSFRIRNMGNKTPSTYTLNVAVDGTTVETLTDPISVTGNYETVNRTLKLDDISTGSHTLSVSVATINGEVPTENTYNDQVEGSFIIYEGEMPERQMHLIENFTSIYCGYCPLGHGVLEAMQEANPDKYSWIALHSIYMGADTLALYQNDYLTVEYFFEVYYAGLPSGSFDRAPITSDYLGESNAYILSLGYYSQYAQSVANALNEAIDNVCEDIPTYVSVDITPEYNPDTRELKITVSGSGCGSANELIADHLLTVYLTEDGIAGRQEDYMTGSARNGYLIDYTHNNVLRAIPTTYEWGDDISWTSDRTYSNTITTTLDKKWDDSQMYITAFVSGPMAVYQYGTWYLNYLEDGLVNNTNRVKITDVSTGISAVTTTGEELTKTYYTTDGRQLSAPVKGVNIVKSSDGSVKKLYVK